MDDADILHLAQMLKPALPELIGDKATRRRLAETIAAAESGRIAPVILLHELARETPIRHWLNVRLAGGRGEMRAFGLTRDASYLPLAGQGTALPSAEFVCPVTGCGKRWFRQRVGQEPPLCEAHQVRLIPKT